AGDGLPAPASCGMIWKPRKGSPPPSPAWRTPRMSWPQPTDYSAAAQNPQSCFADADLKAGTAEVDGLLGLPLTYAGGFANVYKLTAPAGDSWAVKCFTRAVPGLQQRYSEISRHLREQSRRFTVEFRYLDQGVRVKGAWFPVLKMRWVEGLTLNDFLRRQAHSPAVLDQLGGLWLRLAQEMRDAQMGHGDLQHGNVLLVPG